MNSSQVYATSLQASYRSAALVYMSFCSPAHAHSQSSSLLEDAAALNVEGGHISTAQGLHMEWTQLL